jgi:hypothetical protein
MVEITKTVGDQGNTSSEDVALAQPYFIVNLFLVLFSFVILVSGCHRNETPTPANSDNVAKAPDGTKYLALERFETKKGAFELGMAPCIAEGCAFEVRWQEANKPILSIAMPVFAVDQAVGKEASSLGLGTQAGLYAWGTGMQEGRVSTVARPISLDSDTMGLLVTQRFGYEYVNQLHRLVVPRDGKLVFLWEFTDGRDYTSSAAVVSPPSGITLFYKRYHYKLSDPDSLRVKRFILNKDKGELVPAPQGVVAAALLVGDFTSPDVAYRHQQNDANHCFRGYDVYSGDSVKSIPKGHSALVQVFVQRKEAEAEKKRLVECGSSFNMSIVDVQSSPTIYPDEE